jgi:hypothetical protein
MKRRFAPTLLMLAATVSVLGIGLGMLRGRSRIRPEQISIATFQAPGLRATNNKINQELSDWAERAQVESSAKADNLLIARRISLALIGCGMSLEEIRAFESVPEDQQIYWWAEYLLQDPRWANYFAERFSRAMVGTDDGPFLLFRRGRFNAWLSEQFLSGVGYDQIVRKILASEGLWTDTPQVNFITASMSQENQRMCDPVVLTGRLSRTFLAQRIDCLQCHDDFLGQHDFGLASEAIPGQQIHFHQLAAFFGGTGLPESPFVGIRELNRAYRTRLLDETEDREIAATVPFLQELLPTQGKPRDRLAAWVTHSDNFAFRRATVNRVWALMTSRPLVEPVDSIPLGDSVPRLLDLLADDFGRNHYDLRRLIRLIVASDAFQRSSQADFEITPAHEECYAVFPVSQLRPEQVAGSIVQASKLTSINDSSSIVTQLISFGERQAFLGDFGDRGVDEFGSEAITISKRLVLMNGNLVAERTKPDIVMNASSRIAELVKGDAAAIQLIYLTVVGRYPSERETQRLVERLSGADAGSERSEIISDIYWALMNSTEFSWNH